MKTSTFQAFAIAGAVLLGSMLASAPTSAQDPCACTNSLCSQQGFRISLDSYAIDALAGTSSWTYRVCNETGLGTGCDAPKDLSHIDLDLPGLGTCLTPTQSISFAQIGSIAGDGVTLTCGVSSKDPSCGIVGTPATDFVAKCDVTGDTNLDPGECALMQLTIAGENPTVGPGGVSTVTKAGPECASDGICGPACNCRDIGGDECLTRSPGFWGTHPAIADDFLPITVCGQVLTTTDAGTCASVTEALCVSPGLEANKKADRNPPYAELVRHLAAAKLNLAATAANGGSCESVLSSARIAACEALCGASKATINASGCIADLDAFNNSVDTFATTPPPFDAPGSADPGPCKVANGNTIVIGKKCQ